MQAYLRARRGAGAAEVHGPRRFNFAPDQPLTVLELVDALDPRAHGREDLAPGRPRPGARPRSATSTSTAEKARAAPRLDARALARRGARGDDRLVPGVPRPRGGVDAPHDELRGLPRDPRAGRASTSRRSGRPTPFVPGETPVPVSGRVFDAEELRDARRCLARLLAHHRPLRGASSRRAVRRVRRRAARHPRQLRLSRQPARPLRLTSATRSASGGSGPATR